MCLRVTHYDGSDVRKAVLTHVPMSEKTMPHIVSRCRDIDANVRKTVYVTVLESLESPKQLTIAQREKLVSSGVSDRDSSVSSAAEKLIGSWMDLHSTVTDFVELFDFELVVDEGDTTPNPAQQALNALFRSRKDVLDAVELGDDFWRTITTAKAFFARVFVEYCSDTKDDEGIESSVPVMTHLAFMLQTLYNDIMGIIDAAQEARAFGDADEGNKDEGEAADKRFILKQLMRLSLNLDYADEIGRRKMFQLIRRWLPLEKNSITESALDRPYDIARSFARESHSSLP